MSSEDVMQFVPLAAIRDLFSRMPVKFGAAMISSAALGVLLGHALFSDQQNRIPLDEWQPFVGQERTTSVDAEPLLNETETTVRPDVLPAHTAPRDQAFSAVRQFSELLHIPAAKVSTNEDEPQRVSKDMAPSRPPKPIIRRDPRLVSAAPDRPPDTSTLQVTEQAGTEAAKDQDGGLMQRSYRALASAPSKLWSTTQDAAKSVGSFGGAAWDRIKP